MALAKSQLLEEKEARTKIEQKLAELSATVMPLLLEKFQKNNPKEKILKTLAILFLDIKGFSKFTDQQRSDALDAPRRWSNVHQHLGRRYCCGIFPI